MTITKFKKTAKKIKMRSIIKNKKGFLRIIEAVIAILLILGVLIFVTVRSKTRAETDLSNKIPPLLDEIAKTTGWRNEIVMVVAPTLAEPNPPEIEALEGRLKSDFLDSRITNPRINSDIEICAPLDEQCPLQEWPEGVGNMFAGERIISAVLPQYDAKKVKIFLWISA